MTTTITTTSITTKKLRKNSCFTFRLIFHLELNNAVNPQRFLNYFPFLFLELQKLRKQDEGTLFKGGFTSNTILFVYSQHSLFQTQRFARSTEWHCFFWNISFCMIFERWDNWEWFTSLVRSIWRSIMTCRMAPALFEWLLITRTLWGNRRRFELSRVQLYRKWP